MRQVTASQLDDIALGAAVLGTGGGGDPYIGKLMAKAAIERNGPVTMLDPSEVADDALVIPAGMMGAPTVMLEKIPRGTEIVTAFEAIQSFLGRKATATMSVEAGGLNSTTPFIVAAELGIPLVDADMMGRAFPELQMVMPTLYGITATPLALADEKGNSAILNTINNKWTETLARTMTVDMGCSAMLAAYVMSGVQVKEAVVGRTITQIEMIGRVIREAQTAHVDPIEAVRGATGGYVIWRGKVTDVSRRTETGFARGDALISGVAQFEGKMLRISFQNEFLIAQTDHEILVTTPDLITVLDAETGHPITTESLRYGFRVAVLGMPCDRRWRSPKGVELVGPGYFGYKTEYRAIEERYGVSLG